MIQMTIAVCDFRLVFCNAKAKNNPWIRIQGLQKSPQKIAGLTQLGALVEVTNERVAVIGLGV